MPAEYGDDESVNLLDYWRIIWRRRWAVLAVFMLVVIGTAMLTFRAKPIYVASARILIEKEAPRVVQFDDVVPVGARGYDDYFETQVKVLQSETLTESVIEKLGLQGSPEFHQEQDMVAYYANPRTWLRLLTDLLTPLLTPPLAEPPKVDAQRLSEQAEQQELIGAFLERLRVRLLSDTRIVTVSFEGYDPELVTDITNTLAESYIQYNYEKKYRVSRQAVQWLTDRLGEVKVQVEESERNLQEYKTKHRLVSLEDKQNIIQQKLAELNSEMTRAKTETIGRETLYKQLVESLRDRDVLESLPAVINNPLIQDLKDKYATSSAQYSELSERYGQKHPKMIRLQAQIEEMRQKIDEEVEKIAASVETEYRVAKAREEMLEESLEEQKQAALDLSEKAIGYGVLKRQAESNRAMYESLLNRLKETDITSELDTSNIEILDRARIPLEPSKPRKGRNMMFAVLMGLFLGVGTAHLLDHLDNRVKVPQDVERHLDTQCLGFVSDYRGDHVGHMKRANGLVTVADGDSEVSESFRYIRSNLLACAHGNEKGTVLLVSSALPREGKSFISSNLAIMLANLEKKRVLLVDADLRKPRLHQIFYLKRSPGLSDVISGQCPVSEAIANANVGELKILTSGSRPSAPAELLESERVQNLVAVLKNSFDFILFDSPPVLSVSDPLALARCVDGTILVVGSKGTPVAAVQGGLERFREIDVNIYGVVLNRVNIRGDGYYYHHYYGYRDYYSKKGLREEA